jgi:hypothetical protein
MSRYLGVNFNNLRKALHLLFFGVRNGDCDNFDSEKYKYIIPMQGNFDNPLTLNEKDTYVMYWIDEDYSLTQDDYVQKGSDAWNRQKCVADILLRFIGKDAEDWAKSMRHLCKRSGVTKIWSGVMNAEKLVYTAPIQPIRVNYSGKNSQVAFDVRFKLYYDECIDTGWEPLTGIDLKIEGNIVVEDNK